MTTGEKIREIRQKRHKTLDEVGQAIGASATTVSKYESGKVTNIPAKKLKAIADFLEVPIVSIIGFDDEKNDDSFLSIDEQLMIEDYRRLSMANQETIRILINRLLVVENEKEPEYIQLTL